MPFVNMTKPAQGDATRKSLIDTVIDNLVYLYNSLSVLTASSIVNPSFELDTDSNGIPDSWTRTLFTGGTSTLDLTDSSHGRRAFKLTSPGGIGNGGGYLESLEFLECSPNRPVVLTWQMKSTAVDVRNKVDLRWYDRTFVTIATATVFDNNASNPTAWTLQAGSAVPPSGARYFKIRLVGCDSSDDTAGSTWFDDLDLKTGAFRRRVTLDAPGTYVWKCPTDVNVARVICIGGGGGGGSGISNNEESGGGGGGSGYAESFVAVTPGNEYSVGGGGGGGSDGSGASSTFGGGTVVGNGGTAGAAGYNGAGGGAGGAGGGGTGQTVFAGETGSNGVLSGSGGRGGFCQYGGIGGAGASSQYSSGSSGGGPGGGGGGGWSESGNPTTGGGGGVGRVIIEF